MAILLAGVIGMSCSPARKSLRATESAVTETLCSDSILAARGERREERREEKAHTVRGQILAPVEAESASLGVSLTSLLDLPEGAGYHSRSGRAAVARRREGDGIRVTANCDSVLRLCEFWEEAWEESSVIIDSLTRELHAAARREILNKEREERDEREERSNGAQTVLKWLLIGMAAGIAGTIILIIKTDKK